VYFYSLLLPPLHLKKFESLLPRDDLCQVWLNWPSGSGEDNFQKTHPIFTFGDYLLFEEDLALYLKKLEFPSSKDNLYQV
jgi:hypothetical protein